jgi:hypothetical protein
MAACVPVTPPPPKGAFRCCRKLTWQRTSWNRTDDPKPAFAHAVNCNIKAGATTLHPFSKHLLDYLVGDDEQSRWIPIASAVWGFLIAMGCLPGILTSVVVKVFA